MKEAVLYKMLPEKSGEKILRCVLCAHYCQIKPHDFGECKIRQNLDGTLFTRTWGMVEGLAIDPIEKKPFFHFKPGTKALSFGTPGCNFMCANCQNCDLSQAFYENTARARPGSQIKPESIADAASRYKADGIAYTYSEPTIFFEMVRDTVHACRNNEMTKDLYHVFISNGYFSKEMLDMVRKEKLLDAMNIDLKFMDDEKYQRMTGGRLAPVLKSIERVNEIEDIHLEIINLVIPGENDSDDDLKKTADYLAGVSVEIPLHFSRFYPRNKMEDSAPTPPERLGRAVEIAKDAGMKYVFIGNTNLQGAEDTHCPNCGELLISRSYYGLTKNVFRENKSPHCPVCSEKINIVL